VGLPAVDSDAQGALLHWVYLLLSEKRRWPTFRELADALYRKSGLSQSFELWAGMPAGLVRPSAPASETGGDSTPVGLTAAGAVWVLRQHGRAGAADRFVKAFLTCIERALFLDLHSSGTPLTSGDGIDALGTGGGARVDEMQLLGFILAGEPLGFTTVGFSTDGVADWTLTPSPAIRKFLGVLEGTIDDLDSYWIVRNDVLEPTPAGPATATQSPQTKGEVGSLTPDTREPGDLLQRSTADRPATHGTDANTMIRPTIFIGSSTLGWPIADHLKAALEERYDCDATVWHEGVFELGGFTLTSLETAAKGTDFAVLVATADDTLTTAAGQTSSALRDNVVFELGLFIGALGSPRVYVVADRTAADLHLPSDLAGVTWAPYRERADGNLDAAVGSAATKIGTQIKRLGRRGDTNPMSSEKFVIPPPIEDPPEGSRAPTGASERRALEMQADRWKPGTFGGVSVHGRIRNKDTRSYAMVSIRATFVEDGSMVGSATGLVSDLAPGASKVFELVGKESIPDEAHIELQVDTKL
jgi:predicted nucleotide-binding protein